MKIKKTIIIILAVIMALIPVAGCLTGCSNKQNKNGKLDVVVTTFSTYDFIKHIAGDNVNLTMLLKPGQNSHSFEPTPQDIVKINDSDLYVYVGGEMESWMDKTKNSITNENTYSIMSFVSLKEESEIDGAEKKDEEDEEDEIEYDEHVWTSPSNAINIIRNLTNILCQMDKKNTNTYRKNSEEYVSEIENVKTEIKDVVDSSVRKKLVFGDKMPMQYFIDEYGLDVSAAFSGCSTETEPSAETIAYLVNVVKNDNIPVVLYIELSTGQVAKTIATESGAKPLQIQTLHNISKEDFDKGETYVSLMKRNVDVLKEALN